MLRALVAAAAALVVAQSAPAAVYSSPVKFADSNNDGLIHLGGGTAKKYGITTKAIRLLCAQDGKFYYAEASDKTAECPAPVQPLVDGKGKNGAVAVVRTAATGLTIGPARSTNAYRAVEQNAGSLTDSTITGLYAVELQRDCIRLKKAVRVTIRNVYCKKSSVLNASPELPEGLAITAGSGILVENSEFAGFKMIYVPGKYTNGDGVATEGGVDGITFRGTLARDSSDGCYDLKSLNTRLEDTRAERCNRNYRFWGTGTAGTITSTDANLWHVGLYRGNVNYRIAKLIVRSTTKAAVFHSEVTPGTGVLVVDSCDIQVPKGTRLFEGTKLKTLVLGPTCVVPQ